jgi:hypothetical protein
MILFLFEDYKLQKNFIECKDINGSGIERFGPSPLVTTLLRYSTTGEKFKNADLRNILALPSNVDIPRYVISTGVAHSPYDWCGDDYTPAMKHRKNLFEYLNPKYIEDIRKGRALLLIDQSHEGYQPSDLWSWFHTNCTRYGIDPTSIIYVTGNIDCAENYKNWADSHGLISRLLPVPNAHFENMIFTSAVNRVRIDHLPPLPNYKDQIKYKQENLHKIKDYNALQKRVRAHRIWLFKKLHDHGLFEHGINTMNEFHWLSSHMEDRWISEEECAELSKFTPMIPVDNPTPAHFDEFSSQDCGKYISDFYEDITLNTWVSVISEAIYSDHDGACFISEKSFKPIATCHPFIIYGAKHSLKYIRSLGYKTFHPYIDESYDEMNSWDRMDAIIKEIIKIKNKTPEEKLEWYAQLKDILEFNYAKLKENSQELLPQSMLTVMDYAEERFKNVQ